MIAPLVVLRAATRAIGPRRSELGDIWHALLLGCGSGPACKIELEQHSSSIGTEDGIGDGQAARGHRACWIPELEPTLGPDGWSSAGSRRGCSARGREIDDRILPAEAGLDATHVSFTKGCYPGQDRWRGCTLPRPPNRSCGFSSSTAACPRRRPARPRRQAHGRVPRTAKRPDARWSRSRTCASTCRRTRGSSSRYAPCRRLHADWWTIRRRARTPSRQHRCPLCGYRLHAMSPHVLIAPEGDTTAAARTRRVCRRRARRRRAPGDRSRETQPREPGASYARSPAPLLTAATLSRRASSLGIERCLRRQRSHVRSVRAHAGFRTFRRWADPVRGRPMPAGVARRPRSRRLRSRGLVEQFVSGGFPGGGGRRGGEAGRCRRRERCREHFSRGCGARSSS